MKLLKYLLFTLIGLGLLWLAMSLFAKKSYRIERSLEIDAPRDIVREQLRLYKNFTNWSPWHYKDPNMKITIEGTDGEVGAVYRWESENKDVGRGYQKMMAQSPSRLDFEVDFGLGPSPAYFLLEGDTITTVTWVFEMRLPFLMRPGGMLTDINNFVGKDYEIGLVNLKRYCEAMMPKKYRGYRIHDIMRDSTTFAFIRQEIDFQDIPSFLKEGRDSLWKATERAGAAVFGLPVGLFWAYDTLLMKTDMAAALELVAKPKKDTSLQTIRLGGRALLLDYLGHYEGIEEAHHAMADYLAEQKLTHVPPIIEQLLTDPEQEPDTARWLTRIIYFLEQKQDSTVVGKK